MNVTDEFEKSKVLEYQINLNNDRGRRESTMARELRRIEDIIHIQRIYPGGKSALCIGSRDDSEPESFVKAGYSVSAIDICTETKMITKMDMADISRDKLGLYDVIYCSHVLEHVMDPMRTLKAIRSIAKKVVFIILPIVDRAPDIEHPTVYEIMKHLPETNFINYPQAWEDFVPLSPFELAYRCYRNGLTEEYEVAFALRMR